MKIFRWLGIIACLALIATCFLPWVHYNSINETFTGFNVRKFDTGVYYGKAGYGITILTLIVFILMLIPIRAMQKAATLFAGFLVAYAMRTYILFTGSLFEGEVVRKPGIYLIVGLAILILIATLFPSANKPKAVNGFGTE